LATSRFAELENKVPVIEHRPFCLPEIYAGSIFYPEKYIGMSLAERNRY